MVHSKTTEPRPLVQFEASVNLLVPNRTTPYTKFALNHEINLGDYERIV